MKHKLVIAIIIFIALPVLTFGQSVSVPENPQQVKEMGDKAITIVENQGAGIIKDIFKNEVLPVWKKMFTWAKTRFWDNKLETKFSNLWKTSKQVVNTEVQERKPEVKEEFQKEKQELKTEAPVVGKSLWEKFKEIIK
jgi:hypothetical protein